MDLYEIFATDKDKELNGVWVDIEYRGRKGSFKIARTGNDKFNQVYLFYKNQKRFTNPQSDEAKAFDNDCLTRAMAEAILLDIGADMTDQGEPIKYTPEIGYQILTKYSTLRDRIALEANEIDHFAMVKTENLTKN